MTDTVFSIAILTAKPGKATALRESLLKLIAPTRAEPGNLDYVLFERTKQPGIFYMREAFVSQRALDQHFETPHFRAFASVADDLLAEPLQLIFLDQVSP